MYKTNINYIYKHYSIVLISSTNNKVKVFGTASSMELYKQLCRTLT